LNPERKERIESVAARRQLNLTVILENVRDPHNLGAVLRTCDSVGISEVYVMYTDKNIRPPDFRVGKRTSQGTRKWVDVIIYDDLDEGMKAIKKKYDLILATHLHHDAQSIHETDLTGSCALLLGNERDGLTEQALKWADVNIVIPQMGMAQSLNISVACAVTLYEALRQRTKAGLYEKNTTRTIARGEAMKDEYIRRHQEFHVGAKVINASRDHK